MRSSAIVLILLVIAGCASVDDRVPPARIGQILELPSEEECPGVFFASGHTSLEGRRGRVAVDSRAELSYWSPGMLRDADVDALAAVGPFDTLMLDDCALSTAGLKRLARLTQARTLFLSGPGCKRDALQLFSEWHLLETAHFSVQGEPLGENDLAALPGIHHLHIVAPPSRSGGGPVDGVTIIGPPDTRFLKHVPVTVRSLSMMFCLSNRGDFPQRGWSWIVSSDLFADLPALPRLASLALPRARLSSVPDLGPLNRCPCFRSLDLSGAMFENGFAAEFGQELRSLDGLRSINLNWTSLRDDETIAMLRGLRLHELDLGYGTVTGVLRELEPDLIEIRNLNLEYTDCGNEALQILGRLPKLRRLDLDDCTGFTAEALEEFKRRRPDVNVSNELD